MDTWPRLSKAPIVEGLIDVRIEPSDGSSIANIRSACDELAVEFPSRQELVESRFNVLLDPSGSSLTTNNTPGGVILRSADEKWVVQFRVNGFTVSRLQPYRDWNELLAKAQSLWAKYSATVKSDRIVRLALRFVNRVPLIAGEPFEKTFQTNYVLGPGLPQYVAGYLLRVVIPFEEQHVIAIVTQSLDGNTTDCILDLDTFSDHPEGIADHEMWDRLEVLRGVKNRLFFGSLTEVALERFK